MFEQLSRPVAPSSAARWGLRVAIVLLLAAFASQWQGSRSVMASAFTPGAGSDALPPRVVAIRALIEQHPGDFQLSPGLQDRETWQRTVEYLYPVRVSESSRRVLAASGDAAMSACRLVESAGDIALYDCPG
jgi:hypothetical protein